MKRKLAEKASLFFTGGEFVRPSVSPSLPIPVGYELPDLTAAVVGYITYCVSGILLLISGA